MRVDLSLLMIAVLPMEGNAHTVSSSLCWRQGGLVERE